MPAIVIIVVGYICQVNQSTLEAFGLQLLHALLKMIQPQHQVVCAEMTSFGVKVVVC